MITKINPLYIFPKKEVAHAKLLLARAKVVSARAKAVRAELRAEYFLIPQ